MSKMDYNGQHWFGTLHTEQELFSVSLSDTTFQRHLNAYLESRGVPTQTYLELMRYVDWVYEQRYQAVQHLRSLDYWRECKDPQVHIVQVPYSMRR
jgi:hypothetical protein